MINFIKISIRTYIIINYLFSFIYLHHVYFELSSYSEDKINKIKDEIFSHEDFIDIMKDNSFYTKIEIGQPKQEMKAWINTEEYSYFIYKDICKLDSNYDEKKSNTFRPNNEYQFFYNGYGKTIYMNESIFFEEKEIKNFPIMLMKDPRNDEFWNQRFSINDITGKSCITIGLRFTKNYNDNISKNFISILNELDIVDSYIIFLEYDKTGKEKSLIIGEYPEMIFKNKYKSRSECVVNIKIYNRFKPQWGLQLDKIYSGNIKIEKTNVAFHHNSGLIYAPQEYKEIIEKTFFSYYFNLKICTKINNGIYIFFFCNRKMFENEKKKFPELKLIKNEFEEEFILTNDDLFFSKGNNTYFLIVFHYLYNEIWELGKPFLKKYIFAYNFDSKIIIHYNASNEIMFEKKEYRESKFFFKYFILPAILFGILTFFIGKKYYNGRKHLIRSKELENRFSYKNLDNNSKLLYE